MKFNKVSPREKLHFENVKNVNHEKNQTVFCQLSKDLYFLKLT